MGEEFLDEGVFALHDGVGAAAVEQGEEYFFHKGCLLSCVICELIVFIIARGGENVKGKKGRAAVGLLRKSFVKKGVDILPCGGYNEGKAAKTPRKELFL